jgi:uncharacterized membrane protein YdjX (TVP38/TMEM64 family)
VLLGVFVLVEALGVPVLGDAGPVAAAAGIGLLLADAALPVPASLVTVARRALFGVVAGALLSLAGGLGATLLAFGLGRRGRGPLDRIATPVQRCRADDLLARYGLLAVVVIRPVPMLAETVALLAGTSGLSWGAVELVGVAGAVPAAVLYAAAGAAATSAVGGVVVFGGVMVVFGAVLAIAALGALASWWVRTAR